MLEILAIIAGGSLALCLFVVLVQLMDGDIPSAEELAQGCRRLLTAPRRFLDAWRESGASEPVRRPNPRSAVEPLK